MTTSQRIPWWQIILWLFGGLLVAYFYAYFVAMTTGDVELAECHDVETAVIAKHTIPLAISSPGRPGIFCDRAIKLPFLTHYKKVYVYGVTEPNAQDAIVQTLQRFDRDHKSGKLLVQFFAKENWTTWSDPATGGSGGRRGRETPLREVWIK
jgi:hypothetical protein